MKIEPKYVPLDIAKSLKEKGFERDCNQYYIHNVIDWFREVKKIIILPEVGTQEFSYFIYDDKRDKKMTGKEAISFNGTYYEALEEGIRQALKLIP